MHNRTVEVSLVEDPGTLMYLRLRFEIYNYDVNRRRFAFPHNPFALFFLKLTAVTRAVIEPN